MAAGLFVLGNHNKFLWKESTGLRYECLGLGSSMSETSRTECPPAVCHPRTGAWTLRRWRRRRRWRDETAAEILRQPPPRQETLNERKEKEKWLRLSALTHPLNGVQPVWSPNTSARENHLARDPTCRNCDRMGLGGDPGFGI